MGNQYWGLWIHTIFMSIYLLANTYTCLGARNNTTMACSRQDQQALLKFKHSVKDDYDLLSSWVGNDCCQWERVYCDHVTGHVQRLYLRGYEVEYVQSPNPNGVELVGNEVSASLGELRHLKYLDLSGNDFKGSRIPKFIGSFKQLSYLNLSNSWFSGNIPCHFGNLSNLKVLDLSSLRLDVDDMGWISGLSSLEHLDLSDVDLSGAKNRDMVLHMIPSLVKVSLSGCKLSNADLVSSLNSSTTHANINYLDISDNLFYGQVPRILRNLTSLEFLDLSYFNFSHAWKSPNLLSMIPSLLELHLSGCSLQEMHLSPTHLNYSLLSNIQHLDLSANLFRERFPSILTNMTSLQVLDLSFTGLNSSVPDMPNLLELDLSFNKFEKIEDVGMWRRCHLKEIKMSYNKFRMELTDSPKNIPECSQYALERLYLDGSVTGKIPESLGRMANLRSIRMGDSYYLKTGLRMGDSYYLKSGLRGPIPPSLGRLRLLEELDLSASELTGPIPVFLGKLTKLQLSHNYLNGSIPESIGRLASLRYLNLEANQLTGPIPTSVGRFVSLQVFIVSSNSLNGTLPVSIGQLTELQFLDVSHNCLQGVVSETHFANLSMLKYLDTNSNSKLTFNVSREWMAPFQLIKVDLSSCKIEDGFPHWLRSQRKLHELALSDAKISGSLPAWFWKLPNINLLDLSHNKLSGPLTNLPKTVSALLLQNNHFNESIPMSLCKSMSLIVLNLSRNRLTGKIPKCLGDLQYLASMIFSSNKLSGVIPSSLGHLSQLSWLNLNNNSFAGKLSQELVVNLKKLQVLDLGDNEISGSLPKRIGEKLVNLVVLRLHRNKFSRQIPPSLCQMSNLQILDVAHNSLSGPIPHCLRELRGMLSSNGSQNYWNDYGDNVIQVMKGVVLEYSKTLKFVINMDLSSNKLVGEIPVEITALSGLVGLNLSNNNLIGGIPDNIGSMKRLNSLDLSRNKLTGIIPLSIADLNFLSSLNLSHNNLSGRIPNGNQLRTLIDPSIYAGNEDLCGAPLPKNCSDHEHPKTPLRNSHETTDGSRKAWLFGIDIMSGFATGFWVVVGVLVLKKQWRHKFFMYAEATTEKIYVTVMVRVAKMKRRTETA